MENPLSPIIADLVMETLLNTVVTQIDFTIPVLQKYVDDLILAVPTDKIDFVRNVFNGYHNKIQFTVEEENNRRIPYLDLMLVRKHDQTIKTEWYIKPIASGRFINFHSSHSMSMKINTAQNFIKRVTTFSTNISSNEARQIVHTHLKLNDYPTTLINRLINRQNQCIISTQQQNDTSNGTAFKSIINIPPLTNNIKRLLKTDYPGTIITSKNIKNIRSIIPTVKDAIEQENRTNVVYKIPCANCEACYVGMTSNKLKDRIAGHRSDMIKLQQHTQSRAMDDDEITRLSEKTALLHHCVITQHTFEFKNTKILDSTTKSKNLPILETCHIVNTPNTVNRRTDTDNLNGTYAGILQTFKQLSNKKIINNEPG